MSGRLVEVCYKHHGDAIRVRIVSVAEQLVDVRCDYHTDSVGLGVFSTAEEVHQHPVRPHWISSILAVSDMWHF